MSPSCPANVAPAADRGLLDRGHVVVGGIGNGDDDDAAVQLVLQQPRGHRVGEAVRRVACGIRLVELVVGRRRDHGSSRSAGIDLVAEEPRAEEESDNECGEDRDQRDRVLAQ